MYPHSVKADLLTNSAMGTLVWTSGLLLVACLVHAATVPTFTPTSAIIKIDNLELDEASGLGASRKFPGILYSHNDVGDSPRLFAINASTGHVQAIFNISPAKHVSWEDMSVAPCGDVAGSCIYILDDGVVTGDEARTVYRVKEPDSIQNQTLHPNGVFKYNWTEPGSQTILVDPNGEMYVIGYVTGGRGMIVHLPYTGWNQSVPVTVSSTAYLSTYTGTFHDPSGGDISPNGQEVLIRTHIGVYWWSVAQGDFVAQLQYPGTKIPAQSDIRPGGICYSPDGSMFYTLGEGKHARLYSYMRV